MKSRIQDYLVIDVETGGLPNKTKFATLDVALCEVALVMVNPDLEIIGKNSFLVKPYGLEYNPKAMSVNGLTIPELEEEGLSLKESMLFINDFITSYKTSKTKPVLVGHNIKRFDLAFFENLYLMQKKDLWKFVNSYVIDTLELSHMCYTEAPNYKLGTMISQFEIELTGSHRALPDTIATAELLINYLKGLRGLRGDNEADKEAIEEAKEKVRTFNF